MCESQVVPFSTETEVSQVLLHASGEEWARTVKALEYCASIRQYVPFLLSLEHDYCLENDALKCRIQNTVSCTSFSFIDREGYAVSMNRVELETILEAIRLHHYVMRFSGDEFYQRMTAKIRDLDLPLLVAEAAQVE